MDKKPYIESTILDLLKIVEILKDNQEAIRKMVNKVNKRLDRLEKGKLWKKNVNTK